MENYMNHTCGCKPSGDYPKEDAPIPEATLTDMQKKSQAIAEDIYVLINRLGEHLFALPPAKPREEKPSMPDCFRNDVFWELQTLRIAHDNLLCLLHELGV